MQSSTVRSDPHRSARCRKDLDMRRIRYRDQSGRCPASAVFQQPVAKVPRGGAPRILLGIEAEKRRVLNEIRGVSTTKSPSKSRKRRPRDFCHGLLGVRQTLFLLAPYEPIAFN